MDYFAKVPKPEKIESIDDLAPVIELYYHTIGAGRYDEAVKLFKSRIVSPLYLKFGAYTTIIELLRALFLDGGDKPPTRLKKEDDQAWALNTLANSYSRSGQSRRAIPLFDISAEIDKKRGNKEGVAIGLGNLALDQIRIGELSTAESNLKHSIKIFHEIEDEFWQIVCYLVPIQIFKVILF
jgi:tetratricopeptide (TPR) repeat protein